MRHWRWGVIGAATAALLALPAAAHLLPAGHSSISATSLLDRIRTSATAGYSGYAQSRGGLDLPVSTGDLSTTSDLLGGTNQLRVWWRGKKNWRVDKLSITGETDLTADSSGNWSWDYESNTARRTPTDTFPVRVPRDEDLLPGNLARRLLSETDDSSATRLGSARIAGHSAAGLRITVTDAKSTIRHIDVWALPDSGLPLKVEVYGSARQPVISTTMLDLTVGKPSTGTTAFHPAPGAKVKHSRPGNLVAALDHFGRVRPPDEVAGLQRRTDLDLGAVGVYGRGVTQVSVLPVSHDLARQIVPSLDSSAGTNTDDAPVALGAGAVNLLLSPPSRSGSRWLLVGTVTPAALRSALTELPPPADFNRHRPRSGRRSADVAFCARVSPGTYLVLGSGTSRTVICDASPSGPPRPRR